MSNGPWPVLLEHELCDPACALRPLHAQGALVFTKFPVLISTTSNTVPDFDYRLNRTLRCQAKIGALDALLQRIASDELLSVAVGSLRFFPINADVVEAFKRSCLDGCKTRSARLSSAMCLHSHHAGLKVPFCLSEVNRVPFSASRNCG